MDLVTKSTFTVVDVQQGERDHTRKSYDTCLDELVAAATDTNCDKNAIKKLFAKYGGLHDWESTTFTGSLHCEAIVLGLAVIANTTDDLSSKQWLESNGIFAADTSLLRQFKKFLPLIPVSQRCCPPCHQLCSLIAEAKLLKGADTLIVPGQHKTWSPTALPPFTPRDIAEKCLEFVRRAAINRVRQLANHEDNMSDVSRSIPSDPLDTSSIGQRKQYGSNKRRAKTSGDPAASSSAGASSPLAEMAPASASALGTPPGIAPPTASQMGGQSPQRPAPEEEGGEIKRVRTEEGAEGGGAERGEALLPGEEMEED